MKMHHLLNATALALILGVAPVAAQQSQTDTKTPQAQEETQKPDTMKSSDTSSEMKSDSELKASESTDSSSTESSSDTAQSDSDSMKSESDSDLKATGSIDAEKSSDDMKTGEATEQGSTDGGASATANVGGEFINQQQEGELLASKLIGQPVVNANDEKIGDINDLLFSDNNELTGVVVGVGGFLGIGEKAVAVSIESLQIQKDEDGNDILVASMTQAQLEEAPEFETLEDIKLAENQAQQQAAADREKAAPGMAPKPGDQPKAMNEEPRPGQDADQRNQ